MSYFLNAKYVNHVRFHKNRITMGSTIESTFILLSYDMCCGVLSYNSFYDAQRNFHLRYCLFKPCFIL